MILWLVLFALVIAISFVLALQSMHDYFESPRHLSREYGLYLIRNTSGLTAAVLNSIHSQIVKESLIVSLERLFRGLRSALVIFGPKDILANYIPKLNLLELEDYTKAGSERINAWEVGVKNHQLAKEQLQKIESFFMNFPMLEQSEQFWWQLILKAKPDKLLFQSQIRAVVFAPDLSRRKKLSESLQNLLSGHLIKVPKPFTSDQIMEFYKLRSLGNDSTSLVLQTGEILKLTQLPHFLPGGLPQSHPYLKRL